MKKAAALFLCLLLLMSFALPAQAEGQRLLYPGVSIQGDSVYLLGVATDGGTIQATANGKTVSCTAVPMQETQLGVTYYCVASVTSSLSEVQREQQRKGLIALSEALGPKDSMVLVTMGREVSFGEALTDSAARAEAIDQLEYTTFGTYLYDAIDTVLSTVAEAEGFRSVVFFTDGCDHSDAVKYTQDQIGRIVQNSGLSVSFLALLTSPVTIYAQTQADKLELYADLSLGGVYHAPLLEDSTNYINAMENAAREVVNQSGDWTVFQFDAAELPRDSKTVELSVTWTGNGTSVTGTGQVDTASLPEVPETEPETEPETVPETTAPPQTEATQADVPEYLPDNESKTLYYVAIGGAAAAIFALIILLIISARRARRAAKRRKKRAKHAERAEAAASSPDARDNRFAPTMPVETVAPAEIPVPKEEAPDAIKEESTPAEAPAEIPFAAPEAPKEEPVPEQPSTEAADEAFNLDDIYKLLGGAAPESGKAPEAETPPEEPEAEIPSEPEAPIGEIPPMEPETAAEEIVPAEPEAPKEEPVPETPPEAYSGDAPLPDAPDTLLSEPVQENAEAPKEEAPAAKPEQPAAEIVPAEPEQEAVSVPAEPENVTPPVQEDFSLDELGKILAEPVGENTEPQAAEIVPAEPEQEAVPAPAEPENVIPPVQEDFSLDELGKILAEPVGENTEPQAAEIVPSEPENVTPPAQEELDLTELYAFLAEPAPVPSETPKTELPKEEAPVVEAKVPRKTAAPAKPVVQPEPPAAKKPPRHSFFHRQERWIDDVAGREYEAPVAIEPEPKAPTAAPSCTVQLIPEGNPGGSVYVVMEPNSSRTLGRNQKADIILSKTDRCLSGLHFELQWDGHELYLTDRNSTNGTAITGVRQKPGHWARVTSGATIQAGNIRYKVRIRKN